jgi:hypothetical protein
VQNQRAVRSTTLRNPGRRTLVQNHIESFGLLARFQSACKGKGLEGETVPRVVRLLLFGIKVSDKFNEMGVIAFAPVYHFIEPTSLGYNIVVYERNSEL